MKNRHTVSAVVVIAMVAFVAAFGCSRTRTIETDEGKITLTDKTGTVKIETEGGEALLSIGEGTKLPKDLSKDIPIYKPAEVTMSQVLDGGKQTMLAFTTKDDLMKVTSFYESALPKEGWRIQRKMKMGPATVMMGSKGNRMLNVTVAKEDEGTVISLAFGRK